MRASILATAWLLFWVGGSVLWCVGSARSLGATFDEPLYLRAGLESWRTGSHASLLRLGTMPLPIELATLPLHLVEKQRGARIDVAADWPDIIGRARAMTLVFWLLLLGYGWKLARDLGGRGAGALAVALLSSEPMLLAHASLATTDLAVAAALVAVVVHFRAGRSAMGWGRRIGAPALAFAFALLCKASALFYAPLCMLAIELERGWPKREAWRELAAIVGVGLALTFLYCGSDWRAEPSFVAWANGLPDGPAATFWRTFAESLRIFSNAGEGLVRQLRHNLRGHGGGAFLLGEVGRSFWYYFPIALSIKATVGLLLLPLIVLAALPRALRNAATAAALALLAASLAARVQIGVRLVLPLVALATIGFAASASWAAEADGGRGRFARLAIAAVLAWKISASLSAFPDGLVYTNELWGGSANGYRLLSDSNYDWGQGLPELARWQAEHATAPLDVWYFGTDPILSRLPLRSVPFHQLPVENGADVVARVRGHFLAVGTTLVYGTSLTPEHAKAAAFLRGLVPFARTGTFLVYDFTNDPEAPT